MTDLLSPFFNDAATDAEVATLLGALQDAGLFDPMAPFGKHPSFFHAWTADTERGGLFAKVGEKTLETLWSPKAAHLFSKKGLMESWLSRQGSWHLRETGLPDTLFWVLERIDPSAAFAWRENEEDRFSRGNMTSLVEMLFERGRARHWDLWVKRDYPLVFDDLPLLVTVLPSPVLWEPWLAQGGNPDVLDGEGVPLWNRLQKSRKEGVAEHVRQWASVHRPADLAQDDINKYWKSLVWNSTLGDVRKAIRAHPKWATLKDDQGRNPYMVALGRHGSVWKDMATSKKSAPLALDVDGKGRSLWYYLLINGKNVPDDAFDWALKNVPPLPNPDGSGWLGWVAGPQNSFHEFAPGPSCFNRLLNHTDPALWIPDSPEGQREVARVFREEIWLGSSHSTARIVKLMPVLLNHFSDKPIEPELLRVFAAGTLLDYAPNQREKAWSVILANEGDFGFEPEGKYGKENLALLTSHLESDPRWEVAKANQMRRSLREKLPEAEESPRRGPRL
jgi:hypothetical protein